MAMTIDKCQYSQLTNSLSEWDSDFSVKETALHFQHALIKFWFKLYHTDINKHPNVFIQQKSQLEPYDFNVMHY